MESFAARSKPSPMMRTSSTICHAMHRCCWGEEIQRKIRQRYNPHDAKWYVVRAIGHRAKRPPLPSSFVRFFLHPEVLSIASTYLGLQVRLNYTDVWHNIPVHEGEPPISRSPRSFGIAIMRINGSSNCLCF